MATHDKLLFTPGPLTTSATVKEAMLHDAGSWHFEFNESVAWIRNQLLRIAELSRDDGWAAVLLPGSGTNGVEAVFATCVPAGGKVCVVSNGAYGDRMARMLHHLKISHAVLKAKENELPDLRLLDEMLAADPDITHVAAVHCETTTGILNPLVQMGDISRRHCCVFVVDAMSSFGGIPIDFAGAGIDFLVSSPNKCLEGVPGFCFVLARRETLLANEDQARSLSLNIADQLRCFENNGQFRFTPPTHALLAFERALREFEREGGVAARHRRYQANHSLLIEGMRQIGFEPYLAPEVQSCIISAFVYPADERFQFEEFYRRLSDKGFIIYPGKLTLANTFRLANIGHLFEADIRALLKAVAEAREEMGFSPAAASQSRAGTPETQATPLPL
jgi:2-aminoethylphosphonate-pyruvate transaminase